MSTGEQDHASRLGSYYRRTQTDFGRVARDQDGSRGRAVGGRGPQGQALARQLALGGEQDPSLNTIGHRLERELRTWLEGSAAQLGEFSAVLPGRRFLDVAEWCLALSAALRPGLAAVQHVAEVVGRDVTVHEAWGLLREAARIAECNARLSDAFEDDVAPPRAGLPVRRDRLEGHHGALDWTATARELLGGPVPPWWRIRSSRPP